MEAEKEAVNGEAGAKQGEKREEGRVSGRREFVKEEERREFVKEEEKRGRHAEVSETWKGCDPADGTVCWTKGSDCKEL